MSRNMKNNIKRPKSEIDFTYCDARKCPYNNCLRKIANAPFDQLLTVYRYEIDKKGKCEGLQLPKGIVEETNLWDM